MQKHCKNTQNTAENRAEGLIMFPCGVCAAQCFTWRRTLSLRGAL